jgi:hypothetical protein
MQNMKRQVGETLINEFVDEAANLLSVSDVSTFPDAVGLDVTNRVWYFKPPEEAAGVATVLKPHHDHYSEASAWRMNPTWQHPPVQRK